MTRSTVPKQVRKHPASHYVGSVLRQVWNHPSNRSRRIRAILRSVGWQLRKRVLGRPIMLSYAGYKLRCYPDTGSAANVIYFTERFDPDEQRFLERYLRAGDDVVDIGANVGLYTLWMAALTAPSGCIQAFEAAPKAARRLRENVALNNLHERVVVHELAASHAAGEVDFSIDFDVSNAMTPDTSARTARTTRVRTVSLDEHLGGATYALGKIDVEGAEQLVLEGWRGSLSAGCNPPVLLLELLPGQLAKQGTTVESLLGLLHDCGYELMQFDDAARSLTPVADPASIRGNAIAVAQASLEHVRDRVRSA